MRKFWVSALTTGTLAALPLAAQATRIDSDANTLNYWHTCPTAVCYPLVPVYARTGGERFVLVPRPPVEIDAPNEPVDVSEPGTLALLGLGLVGTLLARRRSA